MAEVCEGCGGRPPDSEAMHRLMCHGQAFLCSGYIGTPDCAGAWEWDIELLAPAADVVAAVRFFHTDHNCHRHVYVATANVEQLDRLGRTLATAVGLMRRWAMEPARRGSTPQGSDEGEGA